MQDGYILIASSYWHSLEIIWVGHLTEMKSVEMISKMEKIYDFFFFRGVKNLCGYKLYTILSTAKI